MNALLNRILAGKISWGRFLLAAAGFVVGLVMVLLSLQIYLKFRRMLNPDRDFHEYLIVSKEVRLGNTLLGGGASFRPSELENLEAQPFVRKIGVFGASRFHVIASIGGGLDLATEMFLEAVPSEFLDVLPEKWKWQEDSGFVPLILPRDFLNLYNFGYAISRGTRQLSAGTVQMVPIELMVQGPGGSRIFESGVAGFSDRIPSILVPQDFLEWANETFGRPGGENPSKVMLQVDQRQNADIKSYLSAHDLRVNPDRLDSGKAVMVLNVATSIVLFIGLLFVVLAVAILVLNFAILIADAREELQLLIQLGYPTRVVLRYLVRHLFFFVLVIMLASSLGFAALWFAVGRAIVNKGLPMQIGFEPLVVPCGIGFVLVAVGITLSYTRRLVARL